MHQNLSCDLKSFSSDIGTDSSLLFFVISSEIWNPFLKPSAKLSFNVNEPLAEPITVSFCLDWCGKNVSVSTSYLSLLPD